MYSASASALPFQCHRHAASRGRHAGLRGSCQRSNFDEVAHVPAVKTIACSVETTLASQWSTSRFLRGEGPALEAGLTLWTPLRAMPVACRTAKQAVQARTEHGTAQKEAGATSSMLEVRGSNPRLDCRTGGKTVVKRSSNVTLRPFNCDWSQLKCYASCLYKCAVISRSCNWMS